MVRSSSCSRESCAALGQTGMAEAVVPHFVAGLNQPLHQPGVLLHPVPHDKKGAVGLVLFEQGHDLGGIDRGGTVVKSQSHGFLGGRPGPNVHGFGPPGRSGEGTGEKQPQQRQGHPAMKAVKLRHNIIILVTREK